MRIVGKLIKGTTLLKEDSYAIEDTEGSYQERLEKCLVEICSQLKIEVHYGFQKHPGIQIQKNILTKINFNPVFLTDLK